MSTDRVLRIQAVDASLNVIGPVDDYETAEFVCKFGPVSVETCGTFTITGIPRDSRTGLALTNGGAGVIASLDGRRFFPGLVTKPTRSRAGAGAATLDVFGYHYDVLTARRNAWPVPTTDSTTAQDAVEADIYRGNAAQAIRYYLERNLGPTARATSRVPNLTVPTGPNAGTNVTGRGRFHNLAEVVSGLAAAGGGLAWQTVFAPPNALAVEVFAPRDRSAHARFSEQLRNVEDSTYTTPHPTVTAGLALGGGQGVNRRVARQAVASSWWDFAETVIDRRDAGGALDDDLTPEELADVEAELLQAVTKALEEGRPAASFTATLLDSPAVGFLRPDSQGGYGPLDKVTVTVDGQPLVDVVRQVTVKRTSGDLAIRATVGAPEARTAALGPLGELLVRLRRTERELAHLQRSQ